MGKSGKCVKHESFRIETGFFRSWSQCVWGLTFVCFSVEREEFLLETDQHKTNENLTFMSPVHVHSKDRTSNGAYVTRPCAARSTLVYLERGGVPRCTKSVESVNQASWRGKWCPGEVLDPSHKQRCIIWNAWCEILHILRQLNAELCPAWTTERGKLKRGWSPGDSLNLVRVLSVKSKLQPAV